MINIIPEKYELLLKNETNEFWEEVNKEFYNKTNVNDTVYYENGSIKEE